MENNLNDTLIQEYLDLAVNAPEDFGRFQDLLTEDCTWYITPPGIAFVGKGKVKKFGAMAMGARTHNEKLKVEIRNWFTDGTNFCVEYYHAAMITAFNIRVEENVCLVCHMKNGRFDLIHEYVDASRSFLIRFGLKILPIITRTRKTKLSN